MRDNGELPTGRKVAGARAFFLGAADLPIDPPPGWQPNTLAGKIAAGAQFAQTQFCMDAGVVRRYMARLPEAGTPQDLPADRRIAPLRSAKSARWMKQHLFGTIIPDAMIARMGRRADPAAEGQRICVELIEELATIPGVAGVHIMAPGNEAAVPGVSRRRAEGAAEAGGPKAPRQESVSSLSPGGLGCEGARVSIRTGTSLFPCALSPSPAEPAGTDFGSRAGRKQARSPASGEVKKIAPHSSRRPRPRPRRRPAPSRRRGSSRRSGRHSGGSRPRSWRPCRGFALRKVLAFSRPWPMRWLS